jgi:hypothetical protein
MFVNHTQFLARQHASTPLLHALFARVIVFLLGKAEQADFLRGSLFQAVAQVNPTA